MGGEKVSGSKRVGEGRVKRLFRIHELARRSVWFGASYLLIINDNSLLG